LGRGSLRFEPATPGTATPNANANANVNAAIVTLD
jgi:hypothetical protein